MTVQEMNKILLLYFSYAKKYSYYDIKKKMNYVDEEKPCEY